jgi:tellurite resistance protein
MTQSASIAKDLRRFEYLPVALFGSVMGLTGLSIAWRLAHLRYGAPAWIATALTGVAALGFVLMVCAYGLKLVTATEAVRAELQHPIAVNTFATFWVSMLLLPIVLAPFSLLAAQVLWCVGATGIMVLALYIISRWLAIQHQPAHATPAWILPVVGLLDLPLAVPSLELPYAAETMMVGLAIGMFFALPLFTMIFSRLVFEPPLAPALEPSFLILVAPFAVGMSAYVATTGQVDLFAKSLYALTIFTLVVMLGRLRHLAQCCPFRVGWWSVSFPLAASAIAALRFAQAEPGWVSDALGLALLALSTSIILWMLVRMVIGIARGELRALST